jgi:hypothetical protein
VSCQTIKVVIAESLLRAIFYPVTDGGPQRKERAGHCKPQIRVSGGNYYVQQGENTLILSKDGTWIESVEKQSAEKT